MDYLLSDLEDWNKKIEKIYHISYYKFVIFDFM